MSQGPNVPRGTKPTKSQEQALGPGFTKLSQYADILAKDGVRLGLIGPREVERIWDRHILNCAALAELIPDGQVLNAIQDLTRLAVTRETGERSRLMIDISGYRAARKAALAELGLEACERVKKTGEAVALESMNPFERKVVHDAVGEAGLKSESEGEEPNRYVVVLPA